MQTSAVTTPGSLFPYYKREGEAVNISGSWNVKFLNGGPSLPAATSLKELASWTTLPGEKGKWFSGTANYTTRFSKPAAKADAYLLDLGRVEESAEVFINGKRT